MPLCLRGRNSPAGSLTRSATTLSTGLQLVTNIGFGPDTTHCKGNDPCANTPRVAMEFPLRHPPTIRHQLDADVAFYERTVTDRSLERNRAA